MDASKKEKKTTDIVSIRKHCQNKIAELPLHKNKEKQIFTNLTRNAVLHNVEQSSRPLSNIYFHVVYQPISMLSISLTFPNQAAMQNTMGLLISSTASKVSWSTI
jgi:hypothetical protein